MGKREAPQNRKCIDGTITGVNRCIGYCSCGIHPGYLSMKNYTDHRCAEKACRYFTSKGKRPGFKTSIGKTNEIQVMELARTATLKYEGMKIIRATRTEKSGWLILYATVAKYTFDDVCAEIEHQLGEPVLFKLMACSFDRAVQLVFG